MPDDSQLARGVDDHKRTERVPVYLTERELIDGSREATRLDKKVSELIRYAYRLYLYGSVGSAKPDVNENRSAE